MKIGIVGLGFVGSGIYKSLVECKGCSSKDVIGYDRYKKFDWSVKSLKECTVCDILFLCLPTLYNKFTKSYDYSALEIVIGELAGSNYNGLVVIKSTVTPGTVAKLERIGGNGINIVHNPEFLRERCAVEDVNNQTDIVIGRGEKCSDELVDRLVKFYGMYYPLGVVKVIGAKDSEALKIYINTFCSVKIQMLNELALLSEKIGVNFDTVKGMMIDGNWMGERHTSVPGYDGMMSYGGHCLPKDSKALLELMKSVGCEQLDVLEASVGERDRMRGLKDYEG